MSGYIGNIPVPQATQTRDNFTATSGQTTFSTSGYTPSYLDVYLNGVHLDPSDYTATNGTDVVLGTGATAGDVLEVVAYTTFEVGSYGGDLDVTGTVTADGLTAGTAGDFTFTGPLNNDLIINTLPNSAGEGLLISHNGTLAAGFTNGGDVSFYEDTGTTPKFFWDASAEKATIGNIVISENADSIYSAAGALYLKTVDASNMYFRTNNITRATIDSSGNVVIGASSTNGTGKLQVTDAVNYTFEVKSGGSGIVTLGGTSGTNNMAFQTNGSERMRIDSSGNLLVGQTSTYSPSGGGTSKAVFTNNVDAQHPVVISNQTNGSSASASLVLGSYGADWVISNGSSAKNTCALTFARSGAERMRIDSSGYLKFDSGYGSAATAYGCRSWCNFDSTGTIAIRDSGNVSSITDGGTGVTRVNFTNAMPDANYAVTASCEGSGSFERVIPYSLTTTGFYLYQTSGTSGTQDMNYVWAMVVR